MKMYLYILEAPDCSWDEYNSILVQAHTEEEARALITDDGYDMDNWFTSKGFTCKKIGVSLMKGKPKWVLGSYNAG